MYKCKFCNEEFERSKIGGHVNNCIKNPHSNSRKGKIDKQRDEFSINNGWIVIRFEAELVKKNIIECISILKGIINERTANINSLSRTLKYNYSSSQTGYGTVF